MIFAVTEKGQRAMDQKEIEKARDYYRHEYLKLIDYFGKEKHPEKIEMAKLVLDIIEKFIPKEPKKEGLADYYCPTCRAWIKYDSLNMPKESAPKRCEECGQELLWNPKGG